jgi:NADPH:quinone reductase-like Zn-dependent oxidoreductase
LLRSRSRLQSSYASTSKQAGEGDLVARVDAGDLRIEVAERLPLTELAAVHDQAAAGRLSGKTVLTPA